METENKRPDDLVQHITGVMKSAVDPDFGNRFVDLLEQIYELKLSDYGVREHEDLTIEVPLVFFGRCASGGGNDHFKLASVGGEMSVMDESQRELFTKNRMFMKMQQRERENEYLKKRVEDLETALEDTDYYSKE